MSDIPEPPFVPPVPSRLNPGADFAEKSDGLAAFYPTLVAYIVAAIAWIVDAMQQIAATALAGTLPSLSGHALKFMRVNAAGTMAEFVAPNDMMAGTALAGLTSAHANNGFLITTSNLALGASDVQNTTFYPSTQAVGGVTATINTRGFRADGTPYVRVTLSGTPSASSGVGVAYSTAASRTPAAAGTYTLSAIITKVSGAAAGSGLRLFLVEETAPSTNVGTSNSTISTNSVGAPVTVTISRTVTTGNQLRLAIGWAYPSGAALNEVFEIDGIQLEAGPVRTFGVYREALQNEAAAMIGTIGAGQTLQQPSRAVGVTYTNTTGRVIVVYITAVGPSGSLSAGMSLLVNGAPVMEASLATLNGGVYSGLTGCISAPIPNGATYSLSLSNASPVRWVELTT